jgi:serine/threonine-protein kinase
MIATWCLRPTLALFLILFTHAAHAQSNKVAAEALFDRGLKLMQEGKFEEACKQLEQSQATESGIGTMLYLGECYERLGRTASAWALFREASSAARAEGQMERSQVGAQRAAALEPKLAQLTIQVAPGAQVAGLQVVRGGLEVPSGLWGVPVPVDPGEHAIEARAPGKVAIARTASVAPATAVLVEIPALVDDPAAAQAPAAAPALAAPAAASSSSASEGGSVQPMLGIIVGAAGVVALGVGAYFGTQAISNKDDADARCGAGPTCSDMRGVQLNEDAQDAATVANVLVIGGALLTAAGVVLYVTAPSSESPAVAVQADTRSARLTVAGVF